MSEELNEAEVLQESPEQKPNRSRTIWIVAGAGVLVLLGCAVLAVGYLFVTNWMDRNLQTAAAEEVGIAVDPMLDSDGSAIAEGYEGLTQAILHDDAIGFAIGDPDASVTVVEYSDFSCPHCHNLSPSMERLIREYVPGGDVRVVYKPVVFVYPERSVPAGAAAVCAAEQDMFWQMHDAIWEIFESRGPDAYTQQTLTDTAGSLGLDVEMFSTCYDDPATAEELELVLDEARRIGVQGTPTIFVNGTMVRYTGPDAIFGDLVRAIDEALRGTVNEG